MLFSVKNYEVGPVMTNCYFLINEDTKELVVIDPGDEAQRLIGEIDKLGCKPQAILLTHGHFDHAGAAAQVGEHYAIPIIAHEEEKETLENPRFNLGGMMGGAPAVYHADLFVKDEQILEYAGFVIKVLFTPGHTPGGCSFYVEEQKLLFSGDALFHQSIGRTDFPNGSTSTLVRAVKEKLLTLPADTNVFPGHEQLTTIGFEKQYNPFF
ncbi:MBL fold metallo-hydrolase [Eubacterium oxidoreducens]|uniref:Glyoxylase, beta-lactamase superfamily II n=1 Tax=Eubacterium oxidoreducens TaxID=1732 RepID=A0A1G6AFZ2_EUBOX|nr:MBL fold metallo-hydrolase [Eubacterium oxidoreducens]SDB07013.1 Glyoxylase, beta-lactamase superfamily II [Eubacterium oxidoreducens]